MAIEIELRSLSRELRERVRQVKREVHETPNRVSGPVLRMLRNNTPRGATTHLAQSWALEVSKGKYQYRNSAPYAGMQEVGARPHKVGAGGLRRLALWAEVKLGMNREEAAGFAFGFSKVLAAKGLEGQFYTLRSLDQITYVIKNHVDDYLRRNANRRAVR